MTKVLFALLLLALAELINPDVAAQSERWILSPAGRWEAEACTWIGYNVGPVVLSDGTDCGQGWQIERRW